MRKLLVLLLTLALVLAASFLSSCPSSAPAETTSQPTSAPAGTTTTAAATISTDGVTTTTAATAASTAGTTTSEASSETTAGGNTATTSSVSTTQATTTTLISMTATTAPPLSPPTSTAPATQPTTPRTTTTAPTTVPPTTTTPANLPPPVSYVKVPTNPGTNTQVNDVLSGVSVIDYSNSSQGYVMVSQKGSTRRVVAYVTAPDGIKFTYDIKTDGTFFTIPLASGNGKYTVQILEQITEQFRPLVTLELNASMADANLPFLYPSIKVNFSANSQAVKHAAELTRGMTSEMDKIEAIYGYIIKNIKYDNDKAAATTSAYVSDPDVTLNIKKGICGDYSVLLATMLRSQNIPVKVVEGNDRNNGNVRHAWNLIYTKDKGTVAIVLKFDGNAWTLADSTYGAADPKMGGNHGGYIQDKVW